MIDDFDGSTGPDAGPRDDPDASRRRRERLAEDRTVLANERTLAAWWRTAMAAIAAAIAFPRLFADAAPDWLVRFGATALAAFALLLLAVAHRRYRRSARRVDAADVDALSGPALAFGGAMLAAVALMALALAWL